MFGDLDLQKQTNGKTGQNTWPLGHCAFGLDENTPAINERDYKGCGVFQYQSGQDLTPARFFIQL
jgi:hypothetical protein